jgi:hypothetical protein
LVSICFSLHSPQLPYMQFILCVEQTTCCTRILVLGGFTCQSSQWTMVEI